MYIDAAPLATLAGRETTGGSAETDGELEGTNCIVSKSPERIPWLANTQASPITDGCIFEGGYPAKTTTLLLVSSGSPVDCSSESRVASASTSKDSDFPEGKRRRS